MAKVDVKALSLTLGIIRGAAVFLVGVFSYVV